MLDTKLVSLTLNGIKGRLLIGSVEVPDPLAQDQCELDLIVKVDTTGPDDGTLAGKQDGGGGLLEEEGLLGPGAVQLGDMVPGKDKKISQREQWFALRLCIM